MPQRAVALAVIALPFSAAAQSRPAAVNRPPEVRAAAQALRDRLPDVAASRLEKALAGPSLKGPQPAARLLLAEALVRAGRHADALTAARHPDIADQPEARFWLAAAHAGLGQWNEALAGFTALPADAPDFRWRVETAFCRASVLAALNDHAAAAAALEPLTKSTDAETAARARCWSAEFALAAGRIDEAAALVAPLTEVSPALTGPLRYLRARLDLAAGRNEAALAAFDSLAEGGRGISAALRHSALVGLARAHAARGQADEALATLEKLIDASPAPERGLLLTAFDEFSRLNRPPRAEAESFLSGWAASERDDLRTLARLAQATALEAAGKPADALAMCRELSTSNPGSPLLPWVILHEARMAMAAGDRDAARRTLTTLEPLAATPVLRAWCAALKGTLAYDDAGFAAAAASFTAAAKDSTDPAARIAAAWNAAVAELRAGSLDPAEPLRLLDAVGTTTARMATAEFHLERALHMAATGKEGAAEGLAAFVEALPDHPRRFDALTALVELALASSPADTAAARRWSEAAAAAAQSPVQKETAQWLAVLTAGASGNDAMVEAATAFFAAWPESKRRSPLRMRLGELQFRRQDFAGARATFEALAKDDPLHPLAEPALFWAGKSALLSLGQKSEDDAIAFWEEVHRRNGPLKFEARLQVALVNQRRGDHEAALQFLAGILAATPPPPPAVRWQSLCLRGEVLVARNAAPDEIRTAMESFDAVAADPEAPTPWKHEALVRKGACLEQLKRGTEALDAYHTVLSAPPAAEGPDEYWFHRAGEKALRLLESAGRFEEAVEMAKKMAQAPGPRGRAAAALVSQLALKHGIWLDEPAPPRPDP